MKMRWTKEELLIVVVLALGIGANAAMFTLMKAAFIDPLPYRDAERLVSISGIASDHRFAGGVNRYDPSTYEFREIRSRTHNLEDMAFTDHLDFQLTGTDEPVRVVAARVSASFFTLLGVQPLLGRTFLPEENRPGRTHVVLVSDNFWKSRMAGDRSAVGKTLRLDEEPSIVVGVLPPGFSFDYPTLGSPEPADIYVPFPIADSSAAASGLSGATDHGRVFARLRPGGGIKEAAIELENIARDLYPRGKLVPRGPAGLSFQVATLREAIAGSQRQLLWLLLAGVAVLLLIACANTAQILLARSLRRAKEVAIRAALGATRARLIREFVVEGLSLASCGGLFGLLFSIWITRFLIGLLPGRNPILESAHVDLRVVSFAAALSILSALMFAVVPAVKGSVWSLAPSLNTRTAIGQGNRWRQILIAVEVSLSVFLLCGAGIIGQNLWAVVSASKGFEFKNVSVMQLRLPPSRRRSRTYQEYLENIRAIPGVSAAAVATAIPLRPVRGGFYQMVGEPTDVRATRPPTWGYWVSEDYFRVLGIPLIQGRTFRNDDTRDRPRVAVVNEELVRSHGIGPNPIGRQIDDGPDGVITIVGVAGDTRIRGPLIAHEPQFYTSYLQYFFPNAYVLVRSSLTQAHLVSRVKDSIRASYEDQPVFNVTTMDEIFSRSTAAPRFNAFLIGAFSLLAAIMAACGLYSVISSLVSQRTSEIAVRIVLGASPFDILKTVWATTVAWILGGLAVGLGLGIETRTTIRTFSNSAVSGSPELFALVVLFFVVVTLLASYVPLRRAVYLDPVVALRAE